MDDQDILQILQLLTSDKKEEVDLLYGLEQKDMQKNEEYLGKLALDQRDFISAYSHLRNGEVINDKLYSDIGDALFHQGLEKFKNFDSGPGGYEADFGFASEAYGSLTDKELTKQLLNNCAVKVGEAGAKFGTSGYYMSGVFFRWAGNDEGLAKTADIMRDISLKEKPLFEWTQENNAHKTMIIYEFIKDRSLYEKKVKETIDVLLQQNEWNPDFIKRCIGSCQNDDFEKQMKWDPDLLKKVREKAIENSHFKLAKSIEFDLNITPTKAEFLDRADKTFKIAVEERRNALNKSSFIDKNLAFYDIRMVYDRAGPLSKSKYEEIAKTALEVREYNMAGWALAKMKDDKKFRMAIKQAIKMEEYEEAISMISNRYFGYDGERHPKNGEYNIYLQKDMLAVFDELHEKKWIGRWITDAARRIVPEVVHLEMASMINYWLKTEVESIYLNDIESKIKYYEKTLTPKKLRNISEKMNTAGEKNLSVAITRTADYLESLGHYPIDILRSKKDKRKELLFWLKDYIEDANFVMDSENDGAKNPSERMSKRLPSIKRFAKISDISKVENVLNNSSYYRGSEYYLQLGRKMISEHNDYFKALEYFKKAEFTDEILNIGNQLLKKRKYELAYSYLSAVSMETMNENMSEHSMNELTKRLKNDKKSGLDFMLSASKERKSDVKVEIQKYTDTLLSESVAKIEFKSKIMDLPVVIKIERQDDMLVTPLNNIEIEIYKRLSINDQILPKVILSGVAENLCISVMENIDGVLLSEIMRSDVVSFHDKKYLLNIKEILSNIWNESQMIYHPLAEVLSGIYLKEKTAYKKFSAEVNGKYGEHNIRAVDYLIRKQKLIEYNIETIGKEIFGESLYAQMLDAKEDMNKKTREFVWTKDLRPANIIYNPKNGVISFLDYNKLEWRSRQFDRIKFIDSYIPNQIIGHDELVEITGGVSDEYLAASRCFNLYKAVARYARGDVDIARHYFDLSGIKP